MRPRFPAGRYRRWASDNDAAYASQARAALLADGLGQGLSGENLDRQTAFAFGRRVVEPVVTARLSQGDVAGAKAFFNVHRDGMAADDADILDKHLAEAGQAVDTRNAIDSLWDRLGPKNLNDPVDLNAIENDLVDRYAGDDLGLMRARDEVFHRILGFTQARDETHAGYVNTVIGQVKDGASPLQIATLPQFLALPKNTQQQLIDWHREQLADKLTGFAPDQNLDRMIRQFAAYHDLTGDDALKQMSEARISALEPVLGGDLTKQALASKQMPSSIDDTGFALVAKTAGIDPNPGGLDVVAKARLGALRSRVDAAVAAAEGTNGPLSSEQRLKVALDAGAATVDAHPLFNMPEVQTVLDAKPDMLRPQQPAKPHVRSGARSANAPYFTSVFWPGQPAQDRRINFDLASYQKSILNQLNRPAPADAGPWKKVTVGGKSYFEMSDSTGNHISTTAFEPIDDEARARWEKTQQRLQDIIDSPSGAAAYDGAFLAGASEEDQDRALEMGTAAGQIVGAAAGAAGTARNVRWSSFGQSKPKVEAWVGQATSKSYRAAFLKARPELDGKVVVHHAIEQQVLKAFPGVFTQSEIHSLENLRGIPNALNSTLHLRTIRGEWDDFYARFENSGTTPTKEQFLQKATEIDRKYGQHFAPQLGEGN